MGRISSSIGLLSGVPIQETVEKLIKLQAEPRDRLTTATETLTKQQDAVTDLTARLLAIQLSARQLNDKRIFENVKVTSSDETRLTATATGTPAAGTYQFTPLRTAQAQQILSSGFTSIDAPLGAGVLSFYQGKAQADGVDLGLLNSGAGLSRGKIRITDRSGASAEINLATARTIDDVLHAINTNETIAVTAEVQGDRIRLIDRTGQTTSNLRVREVGLGNTARSLGLVGIDVAASQADGADILTLFDRLSVQQLNDGRGLRVSQTQNDLVVHLRDGTSVEVDFSKPGETIGTATATLNEDGDVNTQILFTAVTVGAELDGVTIQLVNDDGVTAGKERVVYDATDPSNKRLIFRIDEGKTTAADLVAALNRNPTASALFRATLAEGSSGAVPLATNQSAVTKGGVTPVAEERTLGEVLATINAAGEGRLMAKIAEGGDRLELVDLTQDLGFDFSVENVSGSYAATDLGFIRAAAGNTLTSDRLLGGLQSSLLRGFAGGQGVGLGELGLLEITNRAGQSASVDLSQAATLFDVIDAINAANIGVVGRLDESRSRLVLEDTTGGTGNLLVASGDPVSHTAERLRIAVNAATSIVESGDLLLARVGETTRLESLNGGAGVNLGRIRITDTGGGTNSLNLATGDFETVGDVIDAINALAVRVTARINDRGDGILLIDEANGSGTLLVEDITGTAAHDLQLAREAKQIDLGGTLAWAIDASTTFRIELDEDDTLSDLVQKITDLDAGLAATIVNDGSIAAPYRLSLVSERTGAAGAFSFDTSSVGFTLEETAAGQDALLLLGGNQAGSGLIVSSSTNRFDEVIDGLEIDVLAASDTPVTLSLERSDETLVTRVTSFVDAYNLLREKLSEYTSFDPETFKTGLLFGSNEAVRIDSELSRLVTDRFIGVGTVQSLESIGISASDNGTLTLDKDRLSEAFEEDPAELEKLFTTAQRGLSARLDRAVESLVGVDNSLLINRARALAEKIERNNSRIAFLNERLDRQRLLLLNDFARMESAIAKVQDDLQALNALSILPPLTSTQGS
jgi:flagellar hook-associated protein 2